LRNFKDQTSSSAGVYKIAPVKKYTLEKPEEKVNICMKEHQRDVKLKHITQSALSEHNIKTDHQILFDKTTIIATITSYFPRKYRETIEIQKHSDNLNKDKDYNISKIWKPIPRLSKIDRLVNLKK